MASAVPDPTGLRSWEDAFQHPLPVVHKLEQQLRSNIEQNRAKLRALVGASYRDLLGTAERIIEMNEQTQSVESQLSLLGSKCSTRMVDRVTSNQAQLRELKDSRKSSQYAVVAQTKILQNTLAVLGRIIKTGGDALLAAKLLVLARLLHKSATDAVDPPLVLEQLRRKLVSLRKKLLTHVERVFARLNIDKTALTHTFGAYALVTSSTSKETLRHFLQIRLEQLDNTSESASEASVLYMLDLYGQTLLDVHELFPRWFVEVLSEIGKAPLLEDSQVRGIPELDLDVLETWITKEVRDFRPWIRPDQLAPKEVADAIASWTKQALQCLQSGLEHCLRKQQDLKIIVNIRQKVLSKYLSLGGKVKNEGHLTAAHSLRNTILAHLQKTARHASESLDFSFERPQQAESLQATQNVWDLASSEFDPLNGALDFREAVVRSFYGRSDASEASLEKLDTYLDYMNEFWDAVQKMRTSRWSDALDYGIDEIDDDGEFQHSLIHRDPDELQALLRQVMTEALRQLYATLENASSEEQQASYLLRVMRDIDRRAQKLADRLQTQMHSLRDENIKEKLYGTIVAGISHEITLAFVDHFKKRSTATSILFEGTPPLPVQPSVETFRFVTTLHQAMIDAGEDLWTPGCIARLKRLVWRTLDEEFDQFDFGAVDEPVKLIVNGHASDNSSDSAANTNGDMSQPDAGVCSSQRLFDAFYLQNVLSERQKAEPEETPLMALISILNGPQKFDASAVERIKKSAAGYWTRTCLLYGHLASDV